MVWVKCIHSPPSTGFIGRKPVDIKVKWTSQGTGFSGFIGEKYCRIYFVYEACKVISIICDNIAGS